MGYTHLTKEERYQIYAMQKIQASIREMARVLGRAPSTVSRELRRNRGQRGYRPGQANGTARQRAGESRARTRITEQNWADIGVLLRLDWSPEQISGRMRLENNISVSPEWVYQFVFADKAAGGDLWTHLRCRHKRRKRYGSGRERRGRIPDRVGIEKRPAGVASRNRIGHWEGDTIIGKGHRGAAVTLIERKSRFLKMGKLANKSAKETQRAIQRRLRPLAERVQTLTFDNGKEFSNHTAISKTLEAATFFADAYASWQRGTNEKTNGLIRQYLPKNRDLSTLTGAEIRQIEKRINHRPRKCLGYRTPNEVLNKTYEKLTVALRS